MSSDAEARAARDFGPRLRELRAAAGLSQAGLAVDGVSASYVSLLEAGKRIATRATVTALAKRLGCTEEFLISGRDPEELARLDLAVKYAEIALHNGEGRQALEHATTVVDAGASAPPELLLKARRLRAAALEVVGKLEDAIRELEPLYAEAEAAERWLDALRSTVALARCFRELGDLQHALTLADHGLVHATRLELTGSDVHAELAATVIGLHFLLGDLARADLLADDILSQLENNGSRHARGSVYWNASLNAEARGDIGKAILLAERALAMYSEDDDERGMARLRNAYAWLLLRSSPARAVEARTLLEQSHRTLTDTGTMVDLSYCETELGRAWLSLGDPNKAVRYATSALRRLGDEPRLQTAHAKLVIARARLVRGDETGAIAEYGEAAATLTKLRVGRQAAVAWRELADTFTALGRYKEAATAYQNALREVGVNAAPELPEPSVGRAAKASPQKQAATKRRAIPSRR